MIEAALPFRLVGSMTTSSNHDEAILPMAIVSYSLWLRLYHRIIQSGWCL